jgi:hypothetical protein
MADDFTPVFTEDYPVEKVPMHPEDSAALMAWVLAKERWKG